MAARTGEIKGVDESLVRAVAHPLRVQALSILAERSASPKELAAELGAPVGNVSYHVRELEQVGLIELVEEKKRRGAVEHFYRAIVMPTLSAEEWAKLSPEVRGRYSTWTMQLLLADASQSLASGRFDTRLDRHLSRVPLVVDEAGWAELVAIQARALKDILKVQAASAKRLAKGEDQGVSTTAALALFEMPSKRAGA